MSVARIFRARDLCQTLRGLSAAPPGGCRLGPLLRLCVQNNAEAIRAGIMTMSSIGGASAKLRASLDPGLITQRQIYRHGVGAVHKPDTSVKESRCIDQSRSATLLPNHPIRADSPTRWTRGRRRSREKPASISDFEGVPPWRSKQVHLICQLHQLLCSLARACIDSIIWELSRSVVAQLELVQCRCRGLMSGDRPMCRGAHSVRTDFSGMAVEKTPLPR